MKEKVVEILIHIMSAMQGNRALQEIDLSDLKEKGYSANEINAAVAWLFEHVQGIRAGGVHSVRTPKGSRRVLHEAERLVFSTEAHGYLIQMVELGLLDDKDMEAVIDRAMVSGYEKLSLTEVREIAAGVLFAREGSLPGTNHSLLTNEDTIH